MITIINFGASPFRSLFYIVLTIFVAVIFVNVLAAVLRIMIDNRTRHVSGKKSK